MDFRNDPTNQIPPYNSNPYQPYRPYQPEPKNTFAIVAMVLGLCSLLSLCTFFLPIPLGALSIVFVILSRRQSKKMAGPALTGLITSLVGLFISLLFFISVMGTAFSLLKPENRDELNRQFESVYGMDFEDYMENFYGEDFNDIMNRIEEQIR